MSSSRAGAKRAFILVGVHQGEVEPGEASYFNFSPHIFFVSTGFKKLFG
jgi:hypothetical protein